MRAQLRSVTHRQRAAAGDALVAALTGCPRWPRLHCMLGFAATRREPDTAPALHAGHAVGLVVGLPRVSGAHLRFHRVAGNLDDLQPGYRGLAEPAAGAPPLGLDRLPEATVMLVPGAAFDRRGGRLGWGGGYYDRALAEVRRAAGTVLLVGVCFAEQIVDRVPFAAHDEPVDVVVTEDAILSPGWWPAAAQPRPGGREVTG